MTRIWTRFFELVIGACLLINPVSNSAAYNQTYAKAYNTLASKGTVLSPARFVYSFPEENQTTDKPVIFNAIPGILAQETDDLTALRSNKSHPSVFDPAHAWSKPGSAPLVVAPPPVALGGNWNETTSWDGGTVPTLADDVIIPNGVTVTINGDAVCQNLTIEAGGTLVFSTANTLTISGSLLNSGTLTAIAGSNIILSGNWTNFGTFTPNSGAVTFNQAGSTISGATTFGNLVIDAGTNVSSVVTVSSGITIANLTLTNGLLSFTDGTSTITTLTNPIPETAGIEVNGANATLSTGNFTINNKGLIRIVNGTANFGTISGNSVDTNVNGAFVVEGGTVNIAGRLHNSAGSPNLFPGTTFKSGITVSGGTVNLATVGNGSSSEGSLDITATGYFNFSDGLIQILNPSIASNAIDLYIDKEYGNGNKIITGGTFQFGSGASAGAEFVINTKIPLYNLTTYDSSISLAFTSDISTENTIRIPATYDGTYTFRFKGGSENFLPVTINLSGTSYNTNAYIEVSMYGSKHPQNANTTNFLNRHWLVKSSGITGINYDVSATVLTTDFVGTPSEVTVGTYTSGTLWSKATTASLSTTNLTIAGLSSDTEISGISDIPLTVSITNGETASVCEGASVTLITTVTGDSPITYSWTPTEGLDDPAIANPTASPTTTTAYTVTVTDGNGFTASDAITITVNGLPSAPTNTTTPITYDGNPHTATVAVGVDEVDIWYTDAAGSTTTSAPSGTNAGTYTAFAAARNSLTGCESATRTEVTLTILKAELTVTADNKTKTYDGLAFTDFTVTYSGFVNSESPSVLSGTLAFSTNPAGPAVDAGTYVITPSGLTSDNYDITFNTGQLVIGKADPVINVSPYNVTYNGLAHTSAFTAVGVESTPLDLSALMNVSATTHTNVGAYPTDAWSFAGNDNYNSANGTVSNTISRVGLTITADNQSKIYDGAVFSPFTVTYSGFVNGENETLLAGTLTFSGTATTAINVGTGYVITPSGLTSDNYDITYTDGALTITPKPLTPSITANNKCYDGTTDATLSNYSVAGIIDDDDVALVIGTVSFNSASVGLRTVTANVSLSGNDAGNYTLSASTPTTVAEIYNLPIINLGSVQAICAGTTSFNLPYTGTTYSPTTYSITTGSPAMPDFTPVDNALPVSSPITVAIPESVAAGTYQFNIIVTNGNGCTSTNKTFNLTINALPAIFDLTHSGNGSYCAGGSGVVIGLSGSQSGITYTLRRDGTGVATLNGLISGDAINFAAQTVEGSYTITARNNTTTCESAMNGSIEVSINPLPAIYNVTGGGGYCSGGTGVTIGLDGSDIGVEYQLIWGGSINIGAPVNGTGSAISFGNQTTAGTYTVRATNTTTGCTQLMNGNQMVTFYLLPTAYSVTGGGNYCAGGPGVAIGLNSSQGGITYTLLRDGISTEIIQSGTGTSISFGNQTAVGTYTVIARNNSTSCENTMTGNATVIVNPLPLIFNVTGGGSYCSNSGGVTVGLDGSQTDVSYILYRNGITTGTLRVGNGGTISFGNQTIAGNYTVIATNGTTGCTNPMAGSVTVTVNPLPTLYNVTGGGSYCAGGEGVEVGLSGSETGISYQLLLGGSAVGSPVAGTGSAISFGAQTATGTYTVRATNTSTGCTRIMSGSQQVIVRDRPTSIITVNGATNANATICAGGVAELWISFAPTGSGPYVYSLNGAAPVTNTGNPEKIIVPPTSTTTYQITYLRNSYPCEAQPGDMAGTVTVTVNQLPTLTSLLTGTTCSGSNFSYTPAFSISGTTYSWSRVAVQGISNGARTVNNSTPISETLNNTTGAPIDVTYVFTMTQPNTGCVNTQNLVVTVNPTPAITVTATPSIICELETIEITTAVTLGSASDYTLSYVSGTYTEIPADVHSVDGSFSISPIPGIHIYRVTATNEQGCSSSKTVTVKVFDIPELVVSLSCFDQSISVSASMQGTASNPLNFPSSDWGTIQYSYDGGTSWTNETTQGPGLPLGPYTVLAKNTARPDCYATVTIIISTSSVLAPDIKICQTDPSVPMTAIALCDGWTDTPNIGYIAPTGALTYIVSSSNDAPYTPGIVVYYTVTEIFTVGSDGLITFKDCPADGADYDYAIYEYPFDPEHPERGFVHLFDDICFSGNNGQDYYLNPNKYYQFVISSATNINGKSSNISFVGNHKPNVIKKSNSQVVWYDQDMNIVGYGDSFNPVPTPIPNTDTPEDHIFYAACATSELEDQCLEEVHFIIYPIPTGSASGTSVTCSNQITDIRLSAVDAQGNPVPPELVTYTWTSSNPDGRASGYSNCSSGCPSVIIDQVVNPTTQTAYVYYEITVHAGECEPHTFSFKLQVEPMPDVAVTNQDQNICPSPNTVITPIIVQTLNEVPGLSYAWYRTNTENFESSSTIPETGIGLPDAEGRFTIEGTLQSKYPATLQTVEFYFQVQVNNSTCVEKIATVVVGDIDPPVITCPGPVSIECQYNIPVAVNTYADFIALDEFSDVTDNCTAEPVVTHVKDELVNGGTYCNGIIRRTYRATDYAGNYSECTQDISILDNEKPSFTIDLFSAAYCVSDIITAIYDGQPEPWADITPERPDYYVLTANDKTLLNNVTFTDNCGATRYWSLVDSNVNPVRDNNSDLLQDKTDNITAHPITLQGAAKADVEYYLVYWLVDACGNRSENDFVVNITIKPRPDIIKMNEP